MGWSPASNSSTSTVIQPNERPEQTTPVPLPADDLPTEDEVTTVVDPSTVIGNDNSTVSLTKETTVAPFVEDQRTEAVVRPPPAMPPSASYHYAQPTPYPSPPTGWPQPAPAPAPRSGALIGLSAAAVVLVIAVAVVAWLLFGGGAKDDQSDRNAAGQPSMPDTYTTCSTPPNLTVVSTALTDAGLAVTTSASSSCDTGDVLSNSATRVVVNSPTGLVAAGSFDLSVKPVGIPPSDGQRRSITFTFPPGSFYALPDTIEPSALTTTVDTVGMDSVPQVQSATEYAAVSLKPDATYVPAGASPEQASGQSLRAQVTHYRPVILGSGNNRWHAQLSAKQPGLFTDGKTWQYTDILDEFAALNARFGGTRLLWSNEWPVFTVNNWWITVTEQTFASGAAAAAWCVQQGFDRDHCFGKYISDTSSPEGTTVYIS
ncbi:hypothetical protein [Gordonia sp. NPDC003585]|uniref:hypothetical protein n=1 Tax=Gordonia sp. NPDC003585 TaxID=3154275 RepID=UPI0033B5E950